MISPLESSIQDWALKVPTEPFRQIHALQRFLADQLYSTYKPFQSESAAFMQRLQDWLFDNAVSTEDRQTMFLSLAHLFYASHTEFEALQSLAYQECYARYILDKYSIDLSDPALAQTTFSAIEQRTWFCPVTDSMDISTFLKLNGIPTVHSFRPEWATVTWLRNEAKLKDYVDAKGVDILVLLEDFVGTGDQVLASVKYALSTGLFKSVVVIPLISCTGAHDAFADLKLTNPNVEYLPVLTIRDEQHVKSTAQADEPPVFGALRDCVVRIHSTVSNGIAPAKTVKPYGPFGYEEGGAMLVMNTNTPDNTLPLYHHHSDTWKPLFRRYSRV